MQCARLEALVFPGLYFAARSEKPRIDVSQPQPNMISIIWGAADRVTRAWDRRLWRPEGTGIPPTAFRDSVPQPEISKMNRTPEDEVSLQEPDGPHGTEPC